MKDENAPELTGMTYTNKESGKKTEIEMPKDDNAFHQMVRDYYQAERLRKIRKAFEESNHRRNILRRKKKQERQNRRKAR